jgi:hypothetical protein
VFSRTSQGVCRLGSNCVVLSEPRLERDGRRRRSVASGHRSSPFTTLGVRYAQPVITAARKDSGQPEWAAAVSGRTPQSIAPIVTRRTNSAACAGWSTITDHPPWSIIDHRHRSGSRRRRFPGAFRRSVHVQIPQAVRHRACAGYSAWADETFESGGPSARRRRIMRLPGVFPDRLP